MASNYDRILASRQRFREQANLTQDDYAAFQQAYVQQFDAKDLAQGTRQAADELRTVLQKPAGVDKPETIRKAYNNYESYMQKARAYTKAGGSLSGGAFLPMQEEDFAKQREDFQKLMQESIQMQKGTQGALGRITALGARVDDAALRENTSTGQLPPGLLDEKTGLPTETAWAAWEKNRLRTAYQDAAQTAGQQQAAITQRQKQQADETERLEGVQNVLWRLLDAKEPQLVRYHDAIVKQQAKLAGISDYQDAADLQRQVETRLGRLGRIQDRTAARAADKAGEVRTARALEYQLDNPSESLDANALKWERDQAAREAAQGLTLHSAANFLRANNAYAQQRYTDEKWKDISAIRNDPTLSGDYQTALEATRTANAAGEALGYLKSDIRRDGAVTRDTAMQARHIATQAGITLPDDDAALEGYLARLTKQEGARLQYALAGLTAAGYDEEKLQQYIKQALNAQQMDEYTASARESAAAHPVGTSLASSAANLVGGMGYLAALPRTVKNTWSAATGNYDAYIPIDENADSFRATKYAQTVREEVARQLQEKYPDGEFLGQNTAAFLYDTGMSMLDNITQVMMGMGLVGAGAMQEAASGGVAAMVRAGTEAASPVSLGVMGLTTASQKLQELTAQGVDATTAYTLATAAGSIEVLTEKMGLDEFINGLGRQTAATTLRQLGQQLGRQMLAEGTEEAASDILNLAADALVRWDQNDFAKAIEEKRRQGYTQGDAVWACIGDQLRSTAGSFAGGALSGAGFGLGGFAMNAASNTNTALGRAAKSAEGFAGLQRAAEAYGVDLGDLTQSSSAQALGAMRRQVLAAAEQEAKRVDAFAKQKGYKKNAADALQTAFASYRDTGANAMTAEEFAVAFDTAYQEGRLDAQYGQTGAYLERAATDALTAGLLPETVKYAYLAGTKDGGRAAKRTQSPIHALRERAAERRARRADASEAAATGAAQPSGGLTVMQLDDYTAKLRTAEGKTVTADQLETDAPERQIILQAQDDGYGPQEANALLANYDGSMAPEAYYEQFREAITAGQDGESLTEARRRAGSGLTAEATKAAWELGQEIQTFLDTDEWVGPAGKQALNAMAYGDAGLFEAYYKAGLAGESFAEARGRIGQMTDALEAKLRAAVKAGARDAQGGFSYGKQKPNRDAGRGRVRDVGAGREEGTVGSVAEADAGGEGPAVAGTAQRADAANPGEQKQEVEGQKNSASTDERAKLDATFDKKLDQWLENKGSQQSPRRFHVGTTSEALQSVGMAAGDIYWDAAKIAKIMQEHPEMSARVIKQVPQVLENPILVMQSQTRANRIVLFGEALDDAGKPVLVAMELQPRNKAGEVMDFAVIASAYGKGGAQQLIDTSEILYIDPDKKRTDRWFSQLRLQLPSRLNSYGPIGTIAQVERDVNGQIAFGETEGKTAMQLAMERALAKRGSTAELVSARELGIGNGTERKTLRVIRPEALTQEQRAEKDRLREKGITLTFVEGRIELVGPDDATRYAKGVCVKQKNAIVVRTDAKMPWQKIVRHEEQHAEFDRNPQLLATRWNEFVDHLETAYIERWVAGYAERYGGLYDAANLDALIEEALCDYAADIEAPEATERYWREVFPKQKETWKQGRNISDAAIYRMAQDAGGQKNSARTGDRALIAETEKERYDYKKSFAEQLEDWRAGRFPKYDTFVLGATPEVFSKIGLNALPMTINQRHIDYALNGTKNADHELSLPDLKQLPRALENPIAIIHSPQKPSTSLIAIIQMRSKNGKQVISAVYVDGAGTYNGKVIDSNAVTTIHGRNNAARMLAQAIQLETQGATAVYWLDKKRSQSLLQGSSSQLTTPLIHDGLYHSIRESGARVNGKIENVTQSLQFKRWFGDWEKNPNRASKVVNEDGTPKVVYHGTNQEFHTFQSQNGAYFFSESQDYAESMAEERGGDRVIQAYLDMRRPLRVEMQPGEFSDPNYEAKYLREAKAKGHDGVIFTLRTGNELVDDTFYAVFDSAQIKSATENIGTFDKAEQDIRYSAEDDEDAADWTAESQDMARELEDERKRRKALESVNRKLREQMKVTPPDTADQRELRGAAKRLAENYGGGLRQKDLTKQLQSIWRLRAEAQRGSEENRREKRGQMNEELEQLAAELTRNYLDKDNPEAETLREIRRIARTTKIQLTPELRGDLDREGGYQDFRRRNFGRIRLANSGVGVDQLYQELSEQWPAYFPESIWNPADQLIQIADVIQDGTTILERSPYGDQDGMQYMKTKILWELGAVPAAQPTLADQAAQGAYREEALRRGGPGAGKEQLIDATAAHEQEQMDQLDAWYRDHLRKVKADREDQIQKVKDRYQERAQAERDRKAEQELKRRLLWHGNRLKRMGRTATPAQQAEIGKIIGEINLACQNMTKTTVVRDYIQGMSTESIPADGYRDKADPRRTMSAEEAAQNPEMRGDKVVDVSDLKAWYEEQKKSNPDFIADRRVEEILANMDKKQIGEMTPREVQQLLDVALNIENEIGTQKKLIDTADRREVYQQVLEVIGDIESTRGRGDRNLPKVIGAVKDGGRWLVDGTLTPVRLLRRFTGYQDNDPLYRAALDLQQGELKQLDYQRRAYARFEDFTKDRKFMDYLAGKGKQKPIEITGMNERGEQVTCRITPDMRVALYLHSKNYQNLRHIQRGGIEIPDYAAYVAGRYTDAYDKATRIRLAPGTVRAIGETMTTREKNYAEEIRKYYNTMSKAEINAVSVKLKGYEVAKVGEYYPIATNRDFVVKEFDAIKYDGSLESFGFLKERKEGGTPILLADATRTLERSIQSHSAYIGMAIPMRNFNKLRGVSIMDSTEAGEVRYQKQSLMDTLRKQWGTKAVERLETMVADLSGSKPRESGMGMLNRIRSNYAGAVLELNPSTGMKQLIAYPSAASVLGWDAMAVGLTKWQKVDVKLISQYTPLLWHRMQGFIDSDLGDFAKNHGHRPKFLNWNQAGDLAVVKQIWKAAEWKVAHENPALLHDVEAWHKATAEFFNRVVLESQANYTTMERGELLRTNNVFWRSISMFKTEPFQAFNVLYDGFANVAAKRRQLAAAQQLTNEEGGKETVQAAETAYREAKKRVAQAIPAVIASNLLEAAITFAWALFRGKDKDWRDEETDEITAASFFKKMFIQAGSNIAGVVPFGSEMAEFLQAALLGDRYYGVETLETSAIADVLQGVLRIKTSLEKALNEENDEYEARAARGDFFKEMLDQMMQLGMATGVPVDNIAKIAKGLLRWGFIAALGKNEGEFQYRAWFEKSTASGRGSADADALFRAALDGDEESMDRMYAAMAKTKSEDSIQAAIRKRTKDEVDSGDVDLETAVGILQRFQTDKAADDLYWDVRGWQYMAETGAEGFGKYNILKDAIFSGGDATAALQELEAHGVSREDAEGEMRSTIGEWYQGKSADGRTVDRDEAVKLLQDYGGNSKHDAEEAVTKWDCYVETGIDYSDLKQQYVAGTLSDSEAKQYLQDYGAKRDREADKQIKQWDCKKDTGIDFDDIKAEYLAGSIDKNKAAELRQKYGGSSEEDAQTLVLQWDCKKDTDIDYEDIKWALIDGDITEAKAAELWKKYGGKDDGEAANKAAAWKLLGQHQELIDQYDSVESLAIKYIQHGNGAPIADFFDYYRKVKSFEADRDAEGKTISGSRKDKVVAYIADLPLTAAQKDGLMLADNAKYKLDDMPW